MNKNRKEKNKIITIGVIKEIRDNWAVLTAISAGFVSVKLLRDAYLMSLIMGLVSIIFAYISIPTLNPKGTFKKALSYIAATFWFIIICITLYINRPQEFSSLKNNHDKRIQAPTTVAETKSIDKKPEIKNGGFQKGLDGLDDWLSSERPIEIRTLSSEVTVASGIKIPTRKAYIMTVTKGYGRNGSNGLLIECNKKPGPEQHSYLFQTIDGLIPNATYTIRFYLYLKEGGSVEADSLYVVLGTPWQIFQGEEGRIFLKKRKLNGWTEIEIKLKNHDETSANFMIVINDVTHGLILDDFSIEGPE